MTADRVAPAQSLVLFDGVCGLCQRTVRVLLQSDRRDRLRFAPLQSELARQALGRHGRDAAALDTIYLLADYGTPHEHLYAKSRAVLGALERAGGAWSWVRVLGLLPTPVLDAVYDRIAARRYRLFGKLAACPTPSPRDRVKFLDGAAPPSTGGGQ